MKAENRKIELGSTRLELEGASLARRSVIAPALLAGFNVKAFASKGEVVTYRLVGWQRRTKGLIAFQVDWIGTSAPHCRIRYAGWPWRGSTVTELKKTLKSEQAP